MKIDPEFKALIPPPQPAELAQLEENLKLNGCRDPLVVWRGILIDGHNRYEICTRLGWIKFQTVEIMLETREHVIVWILQNQIGRRNLNEDQRALFLSDVLERKTALAIRERNRRNRSGKVDVVDDVTTTSERNRTAVAKEAKIPERKLRLAQEVKRTRPDLVPAIRAGSSTLRDAQREMRDCRRQQQLEENQRLVRQTPPMDVALGGQTFSTIVIDPPWDYRDEDEGNLFGRTRPTYATMPIEEIMDLPVGSLAAPNSLIFLWITNRSLPKGFPLLEHWGFRFVTMLTWIKPSIGMGQYFRGTTEHVLFGIRGSLQLLRRDVPTHFEGPRGQHSAKPEEFFRLVESCAPGPWCSLFDRQQRDGWATWGAEVPLTQATAPNPAA